MAVEPDVDVVALCHEAPPGRGVSAVGHDDHGVLPRRRANELVRLAIVVAQEVHGRPVGERETVAHLRRHLVCQLDSEEAHPRRVALGERRDDVELSLPHAARIRDVLILVVGDRCAGVGVQDEDDLDVVLLGPFERTVDVVDAAHVGAGVGAVRPVGVPGNGETHRVKATRGDAREVLGGDERIAMAAHDLGVGMPSERRDERGLVEGAGPREDLRRDP